MHPGYYWLIFTVFLLIMEVLTPGTFFMASLAMGTLAAGLVAFICPAAWVQWLVFCVVATATVVVCRKVVAQWDTTPSIALNVDALVGCAAVVTQSIDAVSNSGRVRVNAEEWRAVSDRGIEEGEQVEVKEVRGTRLFVV